MWPKKTKSKAQIAIDALRAGPSSDAIESLTALGDEAQSALVEAIKKDKNQSARERFVNALGHLRHKESVSFLIQLLDDKNEEVSDEAADALALLSSHATAALLKQLKSNKDSGVIAIGILARIGRPATPGLRQALGSKSWTIRARACEALGEMGDPALDAVPDLQALQNDHSPLVAREATRALRRLWHA